MSDDVGVTSWDMQMDGLDTMATSHCVEHGYGVVAHTVSERGWHSLSFHVPGKDGVVRVEHTGEVFLLSLPGGYSWAEFAYRDEDRAGALADVLRFLDAYVDTPDLREVTVNRRLRRDLREIRISNGAVMRSNGSSRWPPA
jgi:hypothetical protein